MLELSGLYYPNRIARYFFLAMDDVMGPNGLNVVLSLAGLDRYIGTLPPDDLVKQFDFAAMASLNYALEEMYGVRGGRGMALRVGRASFSQGFRHFGAFSGVSHPAFQSLSLEERCGLGLRTLADIFTTFTDQPSSITVSDTGYLFTVETSPMAWGRMSDKPVCHALVGILQECLRWVSNGHEFHVHETECLACGDGQCVFKINSTPIG
ncbi:MAG: 4-vinyl reductase [Anaerolineaceae bacterium]|nr:4-vinyl reductase [Anaerolineaceae bacterium]